jgi:hypothetical protein
MVALNIPQVAPHGIAKIQNYLMTKLNKVLYKNRTGLAWRSSASSEKALQDGDDIHSSPS